MNRDIYVVIEHLRGQVMDISYVMLTAAKALAKGTDSHVVGVLLGNDVQALASSLSCNRVLYVEHPALADFTSDAYQRVLLGVLQDNSPRLMMFGDTSIGGDVAGWLASRLNLPLISSCRSVWLEDSALRFASQTCGGKLMAEGELPAPTALVMMVPGGFKPEQGKATTPPEVVKLPAPALEGLATAVKDFVEPATGDVDISKEPLLVAIGRGIQNQDNIELAQDLAKELGACVCASRPVIDQGWLPALRLVGKSGKSVRPKLYLALGISGAPEHVEGISNSEMIIAINTDPTAPIFSVAKYGAAVDLIELAPVLTDQVRQAKERT